MAMGLRASRFGGSEDNGRVPPPTRYAYAPDGAALAYQVVGEGPLDLLYVPQHLSSIDAAWEDERVARFFDRLASFSRLILFDRRGSGSSSRWGAPLPLEEQVADVRAVMDAAGSERAAVFALLEGGAMAMLFAATMPDRVSALALYATFPCNQKHPGYDWPLSPAEREALLQEALEHWGEGFVTEVWAPTHAHDTALRDWLGKLQRRAMAPDEWRRLFRLNGGIDVRPVLPTIRVPTLVLHRTRDAAIDVRHARYIAAHVPGAKLVELEGVDNLMFLGDTETLLSEIEEFLTGARRAPDPDRVLATVMFTDICRSTERAAELGDRRWRDLLTLHHASVRARVSEHGGRAVKSLGDGVLATFDGPARAIRAARGIVRDSAAQGLEVRAGVHTGEVEVMGGDVGGMAVHIGARVMAEAEPGEVLASGTVKDLVVGSGLEFSARGRHELRGVPGEWTLWAAE
jgi:class 3 adenylate cyclase